MSTSYEERFDEAWRAVGAGGSSGAAIERLRVAYRESHRHYHTLAHVEACLAWLDWAWSLAERPHEVLLALWYHDAVYEPLARDNEARSAAIARRDLATAGAAEGAIARIETMILATAAHGRADGDVALMLDIDLAILGAPARVFERFEEDVRHEYEAVDAKLYATGRARVLAGLAERSPLYATPLLGAELDARATRNLDAAIAKWRALAAA